MALRPPFSARPQLHQHGLQHPCTGLQGVSCPSQDSLQHPVHNGAHLQVLQHPPLLWQPYPLRVWLHCSSASSARSGILALG